MVQTQISVGSGMEPVIFSNELRHCLGVHKGEATDERRDPQFDMDMQIHHTMGVMVWFAIEYRSNSPSSFYYR